MKSLLFLVAACSLYAANIPVTAVEATSTSVILRYRSTGAGTCTIIVSESSTLSPVVNAVNGTLFTNANNDTSPLNNGLERNVVVGSQAISQGSDNNYYSLALHAATQHFGSVTCGSDSGTFTFATLNPRLGSPPLAPLFNSAQFGNYAQPTINWTNLLQNYIDAQTGILLRRITTPGDVGDGTDIVNNTFVNVNGPNQTNWTNPNNIIANTGYATYAGTGTTADYLVLRPYISSFDINPSYTGANQVLDFRFKITGYSDNSNTANSTLDFCMTLDNGQTCFGPTNTMTFPQGSGAAAQFLYPTSGYPTALFPEWIAAGQTPPITPNIAGRGGTVNVSGINVTLTSGASFQDLSPGDWIYIIGSSCPNQQCVIASIVNGYSLTITLSQSTLTNASFGINPFGVKIWKQTASGTLNLRNALFDLAFDTHFVMPESGEFSQCSNVSAPTTVNAAGSPLGYTQPGWNCILEDGYNNGRWYWIGTNGESRHISNLTIPAVSTPTQDAHGFLQNGCQTSGGSDPISAWDPSSSYFYCLLYPPYGSYNVIYKMAYNPAASGGGYQSWSNAWNLNNENTPAMTQTNITPASMGMDLVTQATSLYPGFNPYYSRWAVGSTRGPYLTLLPSYQENSVGYFARLNVSTGALSNVVSSFHDAIRWCGVHGTSENNSPGYGAIYCAPLASQTAQGVGQYQAIPLAVNGLGSTALTSGYVDASTCQALGVTNPVFIAGGATGNNCIKVTVNSQPYNPNPNAGDAAQYPYTSGTISCSGCSQLQSAIEGDYLIDESTGVYGEQFRLVKDLGGLSWVFQRGAGTCNDATFQYQAHSAGWTALMQPGGVCDATLYWINSAGAPSIDNAFMNQGHHDILTNGVTDAGVFVQSDYDIRSGPFSTQVGQGPNFTSVGAYNPLFNGSTAGLNVGVIQSHPSARQNVAPANEFRWIADGRPLGLSLGGSNLFGYNCISTTSVTQVYLVSAPFSAAGCTGFQYSSLDRKNLPVVAVAGRYLLQDISGPGSSITTGDTWDFCVADFAGECIPGSSAGQLFMNVPQVNTSGTVYAQMVDNEPFWYSATPVSSTMTEVGIDQQDSVGTYQRRVSAFLNGIGYQNNFDNLRSLPDGSWAFTDSNWVNGTYTPLMLAQLPPWPAASSAAQMGFSYSRHKFPALSGSTRRIRFGYNTSLYCTSRLEQCSTNTLSGEPYTWVSESQTWTNCSSACEIDVPTIPGSVLYYVIDTQIGGNIVSSALQATAVN